MNTSDEGIIYVEKHHYEDDDDNESVMSTDSSFSVVGEINRGLATDYPSMMTAINDGGDPLEKRPDIIQAKEIPIKLSDELVFKSSAVLNDVFERVKARDTLDSDIENEVKNIERIECNAKLVDENLKAAARIAKEHVIMARQTAKDGQTTVKRAMEIIESALPVFMTVCDKSYEQISLSPKVMKELNAYEECLQEINQTSYNLDKREERTIKSMQHLEKCMTLAANDVNNIVTKKLFEEGEDRITNFQRVQQEVNQIITTEIEEVDNWLVSCKDDLGLLEQVSREQNTRFDTYSKQYEKHQLAFETKLNLNKRQQEELLKRLSEYRAQERKLRDEQKFQQQVQEKAKEWHEKVCSEMNLMESSISDIKQRALTSEKVMESMNNCGKELLSASFKAENEYIEKLKSLEMEAKTRQRLAFATYAVEQRLKLDNCSANIDDYKERMKLLKEDLRKAVQRNQRIGAEKTKDDLKQYKHEAKRQTEAKKDAEEKLKEIMEKLETCDAELKMLTIDVETVDDMYDCRSRELSAVVNDGLGSLDFTDTEEDDNEDD